MAVELGKFIVEQLERLPENHPDRRFLEDMLKRTNTQIHKSEKTYIPPVIMNRTAQRVVDIFHSTQELDVPQLRNIDPDRPRNTLGYANLVSTIFLGKARSRQALQTGRLRSHIADVTFARKDNSELWNLVDYALATLPEDIYSVIITRYSLYEREYTDKTTVRAVGEAFDPPLPQQQVMTKIDHALNLLRHPSRSLPIARHIDAQPRRSHF